MIEIKLRENLAKKNKTMADLNKETGISKNALSQLANGISKGIQFNTLEKILSNLDIPIQDLIVYTPNYIEHADFSFAYDSKIPIDITPSYSVGGDSEENSFEYADRINVLVPTFVISVQIEGIELNINTILEVNFIINENKELETMEIKLQEPSNLKKVLSTPLFTEELLNSLADYLVEFADNLLSDFIKDFNFSFIYFDGNLY